MNRGLQVALVCIGLLFGALYLRGERLIGAAQQRERDALDRADSLARVAQRVDTQYVGEKKVYAGWRTRWDTARVAHLEQVLDSLGRAGVQRPETVKVEVPVSVLVTADSAIAACSVLILTCEQRVAVRDQRITAMDEARAAHLKTHPSRAKRVVQDLGKVGLGALLHAVLVR